MLLLLVLLIVLFEILILNFLVCMMFLLCIYIDFKMCIGILNLNLFNNDGLIVINGEVIGFLGLFIELVIS